MTSPNIRQPPTERRFTALTPIALAFTAVSLCWTGWSITDLIKSGSWGILAAISVDGLWGVVQYLSYKRIGGRVIEVVEWVTLFVACSLLSWHGWTITPAAAVAGALPPIVAKISWVGDIRLRLLRSYDPTALTVEQEAEINDVIRDSEYQARLKAAQIEREAAEDIAAIRAKGKVDMERLEVDFEVGVKEITTRADLKRRTPLSLTASPASGQPGEVAQEARAVIATDPPQKPRKRQPPTAPAGPDGEVIEDVSSLFSSPHAPVVYFLRNGTRVKIGTSQNLRRRVASLSLRREDVVRVEHGDQQYERSLHRRFDALRAGDTEWFELRGALARHLGEPQDQADEPAEPEAQPRPEPEAQPVEPRASQSPLVLTSSQAAAPEPGDQTVEPEARSFGFSAHLTAQSAQRAQAVAQVAELLAQDSGLTSGQVAEALSVSPATAKRYLREARQGGRS